MTKKTEIAAHEIIVSRVFNAPRVNVWKAWTEINSFAQWWCPDGVDMNIAKLDLSPGGILHYSMTSHQDGQILWGKFVYAEILAPERLIFVNAFADEHGNTIRHPMSATWPLDVLNILTMTERSGKTTLQMHGFPFGATDAERATFASMSSDVQLGFKSTLDQLASYLAAA